MYTYAQKMGFVCLEVLNYKLYFIVQLGGKGEGLGNSASSTENTSSRVTTTPLRIGRVPLIKNQFVTWRRGLQHSC
jgi:hypothetical protein